MLTHSSRCLTGLLNGNIGARARNFLYTLVIDYLLGVMKSVMGELTDTTNRAEGFSLMPVVWGFGATMGWVLTDNPVMKIPNKASDP